MDLVVLEAISGGKSRDYFIWIEIQGLPHPQPGN